MCFLVITGVGEYHANAHPPHASVCCTVVVHFTRFAPGQIHLGAYNSIGMDSKPPPHSLGIDDRGF